MNPQSGYLRLWRSTWLVAGSQSCHGEKYAPGSVAGSGAVPYLQSADLEVLHARATTAGVTAPEIIEEPGIHLLKITDPNGQLVEFFRLTDQ